MTEIRPVPKISETIYTIKVMLRFLALCGKTAATAGRVSRMVLVIVDGWKEPVRAFICTMRGRRRVRN